MAFLIAYQEYQHHGFERALLRHCLRAATVTVAFFAVGSLVVAWLLGRMLGMG